MLIPIGIILYTVAGGLKATFISSYVHTVIIYVVLCLFSFMVYSPSSVPALGSPSKVGVFLCASYHARSHACIMLGRLITKHRAPAILCLCACVDFEDIEQYLPQLSVVAHMCTWLRLLAI